jgi:hypothetical protein
MATPSKRPRRAPRDAGADGNPPPTAPAEEAQEAPAEATTTILADSELEAAGAAPAASQVEPLDTPSAHEQTEALESYELPAAPVTQELPTLPPSAAQLHVTEPVDEPSPDATLLQPLPSRPRKTTLAMAITPAPSPSPAEPVSAEPTELSPRDTRDTRDTGENTPSAVPIDEVDDWSISDQPTIYLSPQLLISKPKRRPPTTEMPPQTVTNTASPPEPSQHPPDYDLPKRPPDERPPHWLASMDDPWPDTTRRSPQPGVPDRRHVPPILPEDRIERLQRLREGRMAHQEGGRGPAEGRPVADIMRQWWRDLRPGLTSALNYQREARASGVHPIPAHEPSPGSRLGDAFGRFAATARGMTGRAQSAMGPQLNRLQALHQQAESAASAFVQKMETPLNRQQAPLLGPGRIAVFFKPGVTVGQAQSLLGASRARPIRLIPRKHGFLALVPPGAEAEVSERLREHPYVRDVAYVEYNEYGEAIQPR